MVYLATMMMDGLPYGKRDVRKMAFKSSWKGSFM